MNGPLTILTLTASVTGCYGTTKAKEVKKPNVLFVISDDQSYPYASVYGCKFVKTPAFDKVAREGVLFTNAYVTSPGSSPSRASILTGRYPWQIEEAGTHASSFPRKYKVFTEVMEENGYTVGYTGKPWAPGDWKVSGWQRNPAGHEFNQKKLKPPYSGISNIDYSGNFDLFLSQRKTGQPFFFWVGTNEPHRVFEEGSWKKDGKDAAFAKPPGFMPDNPVIKEDLLDYAVEIEWFDKHLGLILQKLKDIGELENTLVIVTSDNGMPFPRAKANCYDAGIHVPLAIAWGKKIPAGRVITNPMSTIDLAPTIMEATGLNFNGIFPFAGVSRLPILLSKQSPKSDVMDEIFAGRERHSSSRYENLGYPQRAIRKGQYLYIRNYHPEYWPAGDPQLYLKNGQLSEMHQGYMDIDDGATLAFYRKNNVIDPEIKPFFLAATEKRPAEELFDLSKDPACMTNLANDGKYAEILLQLSGRLTAKLKETGDTREVGPDPEVWETYPRIKGEIRKFPNPAEK